MQKIGGEGGARKGLLTNSRDGGDNFPQLQFVQDGGFTSCVQTDLNKYSMPHAHRMNATRRYKPSIYLSS